MWAYVLRRLLANIPIYLSIIFLVMAALRVQDPIWSYLGKNATPEMHAEFAQKTGLDQPFIVQYGKFIADTLTLNFTVESWDQPGVSVGKRLKDALIPSLSLTIPALIFTSMISIFIGLLSAFNRGKFIDKALVTSAVIGMCISFLVYVIVGQYFGAYRLNQMLGTELFAIQGYEPGIANWAHFCLLPVLISVTVAMGYDTRYYRSVMVEEGTKDYIITAKAKGASNKKVMFVHMLKNAMIPIITRVMITLPFLVTGSFLLEMYFGIPGMGRTLIQSIGAKDFPMIQVLTAMFAALFIMTNILTDVLYALVDPRVRLS